jgi:hypothetical protein
MCNASSCDNTMGVQRVDIEPLRGCEVSCMEIHVPFLHNRSRKEGISVPYVHMSVSGSTAGDRSKNRSMASDTTCTWHESEGVGRSDWKTEEEGFVR